MLVTPWTKIVTSLWFQVTFTLRRPRVANFADIIKIATIFIRTTFKDSNKIKRNRNYALKCNLHMYFSIKQKLQTSGKKCRCQQNSRDVSCGLCIFWIFFRWGVSVPSFIIAGYVWQILDRRSFPPIPEQPWNGLF